MPGWSEGPDPESRDSGFDAFASPRNDDTSHGDTCPIRAMVGTVAADQRAARGGPAMDDKGRESGHLMLITPERVFYAGLLGRPRERCPGGFHVYVEIKGGPWRTTAAGCEIYRELAVVAPNARHTIASDFRSAICLVIEPESVRPGAFEEFAKRLSGPGGDLFAYRIRAAYGRLLQRRCGDGITSAEFDAMCFGEALPPRALDPRVGRSIAQIGRFSGEPV